MRRRFTATLGLLTIGAPAAGLLQQSMRGKEGRGGPRVASRWMGTAAYWFTKNHVNLRRMQATPNDLIHRFIGRDLEPGRRDQRQRPRPVRYRRSGFLQAGAGTPSYRTVVFRSIPQLGTMTLPLEERGSRRRPAVSLLNARASKNFGVSAGREVSIDVDVFNVLNANAAVAINWASGPACGYGTD